MVEFTAGERAFLEEMRGLAKDENGQEVLVGLTLEESGDAPARGAQVR